MSAVRKPEQYYTDGDWLRAAARLRTACTSGAESAAESAAATEKKLWIMVCAETTDLLMRRCPDLEAFHVQMQDIATRRLIRRILRPGETLRHPRAYLKTLFLCPRQGIIHKIRYERKELRTTATDPDPTQHPETTPDLAWSVLSDPSRKVDIERALARCPEPCQTLVQTYLEAQSVEALADPEHVENLKKRLRRCLKHLTKILRRMEEGVMSRPRDDHGGTY
ncbi:MAG: RNA polymerase sigma factor [Myxococcota bacterium]